MCFGGVILEMYLTKRILTYKLDNDNILLINTISGAFDVIDEETKNKIDSLNMGISEMEVNDPELLHQLRERKNIFKDKQEELLAIEQYRRINAELIRRKSKRNFTICPTMGCNLRCTYCFEEEKSHKNMKVLSDSQLQTIFKYILENKNQSERINDKQPITISLFGGEPLLKGNYDIVKQVFEFARNNEIIVKVITNGTTIKFYSELLQQYPEVLLQITVDGNKKIHDKRRIRADGTGSFDKICEGIEELIKIKVVTRLRINIDKENFKHIGELIEFIKEKKWVETGYVIPYISPVLDFFDSNGLVFSESELYQNILKYIPDFGTEKCIIKNIVSPVIGYLMTFLNLEDTVKPWKLHYCEATSGENLIFSPDGCITTCLLATGKEKNTIGKFDNNGVYLNKDDVELWFNRTIFRIPKCKECKYALLCGGGCPIASLEVNNDIDCPICSDIEKTLDVYINANKEKLLSKIGI